MQRAMPVEQTADDPAMGLDLFPGEVMDEGLINRGPESRQQDVQMLNRFGESGRLMIGHCAAGLMFGFAGTAKGRRVAVHPMARAAVQGPVATENATEVDGNFYTAQDEHAIPALIDRIVEALR